MESITIGRDEATGLRAAGFLIGTGLIMGRAAAGDWVSAEATVREFAKVGWPALALTAGAAGLDRILGPTAEEPEGAVGLRGALPALGYMALAVAYVGTLGRW